MNLFQRAKVAYSVLTQKSLFNSFGTVIRNQNSSNFRPQQQLKGITYKAVDKIGISISKYEPLVLKPNGDAIPNHPITVLSKKPNPRYNSSDFYHLWAMLYEIYGETFWYLARGETTRRVKEIYLLNPAQMEVKVYDGELVGYVMHKENGNQIPFQLDEIIHDKRPNPFNEWRGLSVLEKASIYVDTEIITSTFTLNYMKNNASPSGIVTLPNMDKEAFKQFCNQWREGYEGPENAGKTAFIRSGEADFKAVGATLKDIDQKVTRDMAKEDVLLMLEVPKALLGISDETGLGRASIETLHYIFNKEKIDPYMERLDRIWERIANTGGLNGGTIDLNIEHASPIPEDKEYKLQRNEKAVNKWITVNEARAIDGLEPLNDPKYDEITLGQPVAVAEQKKMEVQTKKIILKKAPNANSKEVLKEEHDKQEEFRKLLVENSELYTKKVKVEIAKFASKQEAKIIANINLSKKAFEEWLPSVKEESVELAAILTPIILQLMEEQSKDVANFITGELLVISPEIRKETEARILKIAGLYNEDTMKALEKTLTEGTTNGESLVKLKKRVEKTFQDAKGYRAERIARTESLRASNTTAELVYKQNGYSTVRWFINPGACSFCQTFAGRTKTIGTKYAQVGDVITDIDGNQMHIDYDNIETPPLHPSCACSLIPED